MIMIEQFQRAWEWGKLGKCGLSKGMYGEKFQTPSIDHSLSSLFSVIVNFLLAFRAFVSKVLRIFHNSS